MPTIEHLLLVTTEDPDDPKSWSGIPFSLRKALERKVRRVSVFRPPRPVRAPLDVLRRMLFGAQKYPLWITRATLKNNSRTVEREIARTRPDAVLSISSQCVAFLDKPGVPVFLFSDAPYWAFCETYREWETPPERIREYAAEEASAGRRLDGLCFGSEWACSEAQRLYGLPDGRTLHATPLGANWTPNLSREEIFSRIDERVERLKQGELELLYLGKDWERKGGPLAVEAARLLHASGRSVRLHVVGCRPELAADTADFVTVHGPLYQNNPAENAQLESLFLRSHFLIVPTRAECFGVVFAEAQAFGLPPVSRAVHAVPSIIRDGETGLLFPPDAPAEPYAAALAALSDDPERYRAMAQNARIWFEERLTWDRAAESILQAMQQS